MTRPPRRLREWEGVTGDTSRLDAADDALAGPPGSDLPFAWPGILRRFALALIAVMRGDAAEAAAWLDHYRPWKGLYIPYNPVGMASDALIALRLATVGRPDEAMSHFENALAFCARSGFRPELARTCCDYGQALVRRGAPADRERARQVLGQGPAVARELRMMPAMRRIEATMARAALGDERPAGLSLREVEVLRLAAAGKANKEIAADLHISYHTVVNHLKSI
jgi:DNA-binding CsgD family transcriptional regulator